MKVFIEQEIVSGWTKIYLVENYRCNNPRAIKISDIDDQGCVELTSVELPHGERPPAFMQMDEKIFKSLMRGMVEYASNNGISTENEYVAKAKLEMTTNHLNDIKGYFEKMFNKMISDEPSRISQNSQRENS